MSITQLRYAPWHARSRLSPSQYESLTAAVSKVLCYTVSIPDNRLDVTWAQGFVRTYAQDDAKHALHVLDDQEAKETQLTPHEFSIRRLTLQLAQRLSKVCDGLDVSILVDLAVSYPDGMGNSHSLRTIVQEACTSTPSLRESFMAEVVPAFGTSLQEVQNRSTSSTRKVAFVLSQLLRCGPTIVNFFVQTKDFILALASSYHSGLDIFANYHGGITLQVQDSEAAIGWQRDWLHTKASLIDSFHAIVQTLLRSEQPTDKAHLLDLLFSIYELPSSSTSGHITPIPFISQSLLADYQYAFDLSGLLNDRFKGVDDARLDLLVSALVELSHSRHEKLPAGGLSLLINNEAITRRVEPAADLKGKGKAPNQGPAREANVDRAIAQVMDIFPIYSLRHIQRFLEHPAFGGNSEKLISSLLEGTLPPELADHGESPPPSSPPMADSKYVKNRLNVWDGTDFSRLRLGKARGTADTILHDRSFMEQMKADIIRRAEELSSDEDTVDNPLTASGRAIPFFEEELDDDPVTERGVKVLGDGEASDDTDGEDAPEDPKPSPETILILAYLHDPKVYDRDSATRRSKARVELRLKTGWADEQLEGWRIMLERNPQKDKILQKHEFSGNALLSENTNALEPGTSGSASAQRGGRARGRGGRRGTNNDAAQGRVSKEKNKARAANHNRKRGHDKKMARGGAPMTE